MQSSTTYLFIFRLFRRKRIEWDEGNEHRGLLTILQIIWVFPIITQLLPIQASCGREHDEDRACYSQNARYHNGNLHLRGKSSDKTSRPEKHFSEIVRHSNHSIDPSGTEKLGMLLLERGLLSIRDTLNQKTRKHDDKSQNTDWDIDWIMQFDRASVRKERRRLEEVDTSTHKQHGQENVETRNWI